MKSLEYYYAELKRMKKAEARVNRCLNRIEDPWPEPAHRQVSPSCRGYKAKNRLKHQRVSVVSGGRTSPR